MKITILRSVRNGAVRGHYDVVMDVNYADRLLGHLRDKGNYCSACGDKCVTCRKAYRPDFSGDILQVFDFPGLMPVMLEDPEEHLPKQVPEHDVCVAVSVHEEVLLAFVKTFPVFKGIIVPQEGSSWISPNYIRKISEYCGSKGIASAFPKPFCAFNPSGGILKSFRDHFRIGLPDIAYDVRSGYIHKAKVLCSAPCGATYFTARGLTGKDISEDLAFIIDKQLSAYPCTADHAVDREFNDSITHQAVKIQRRVLDGLK